MKKLFRFAGILVCALVFSGYSALAQGQPNQVALWLQTVEAVHPKQSVQLLERTVLANRSLPVPDADFLTLDREQLSSLFENQPALIEFVVPRGEQFVNLKLARVTVTSSDFAVTTDVEANVEYKHGIHYRGIVDGDNGSLAAISFFNDEVMGFFNDAQGIYTMGRVDDEDGIMIVYNTKELPNPDAWSCFTEDTGGPVDYTVDDNQNRGIGCKTVTVYLECDYKLFTDKGSSTTNVTNYVTGLFNQVATLYANENIDIQVSEMFVWTTTDPYVSHTTTSAVLSAFRTTKGTNFNGNLAHFLTTRSLGGGIAYVDVICNKAYAFGVSAINNSYQNVPTYSWTIEVVTHELGHNLGSPHTQSCSWTGGALDNCYAVEGSCSPGPAPTNGGTIMSYCHLTSVGINFNNGFGTQPGDLIRSRVLNATCLTSSGTAPTGLTTSNIGTGSAVAAWVAVPGAASYTVQLKTSSQSTWTTAGTVTTATYLLTGLASGTTYNWQVKTDCSAYSATASFTTTVSTTTCATVTGLAASNITSSSATLAWGAVTNATSYTVQYKASTTSTWGTLGTYSTASTSISGLNAGTTYNWQVKANCATSYSTVSSFTTTTATTTCTAPTQLSTTNIGSTSATLNWNAITGSTSYNIRYKKASVNTWTNLNGVAGTSRTLTNLSPNTIYQWRVKSSCNSAFSTTVSFTTTTAGTIDPNSITVHNDARVELYPNPAKHQLTLFIEGWNSTDHGTAHLFSVTGALLRTIAVNANENALPVHDLPAGMYMIQVRNGNAEPLVTRFVKE